MRRAGPSAAGRLTPAATADPEDKAMPKSISVPPSPGDPYSEVVEAASLVFVAGQIGLARDQRAADVAFEDEARACFRRVEMALGKAGLGLESVVRCTVYLTDFEDFATMNGVFREFFAAEPPVRATVGVTRLARECRIEIEATAAR